MLPYFGVFCSQRETVSTDALSEEEELIEHPRHGGVIFIVKCAIPSIFANPAKYLVHLGPGPEHMTLCMVLAAYTGTSRKKAPPYRTV
jgi:hypothetical protein